VVQELRGQLATQGVAGAAAGLKFQRVERGPYLGVLAQHDEDRGPQCGLCLAQEREQDLLFQVDVTAQRPDRAYQRLRVPWRGGERRYPLIDFAVLSFESRRQQVGFHVGLSLS